VLIVNQTGREKESNQSGLELLTIKALVKPAKVMVMLISPNHNIIFLALLFFTSSESEILIMKEIYLEQI
jgi:hypothetical protein